MKFLILGGTRFVGHHLVEAALARGHQVTLFNRGQHAPRPDLRVQSIQGDRHADLGRLAAQTWDAVIDTCGQLPKSVQASATALSGSVHRYVFVSSVSVYQHTSQPGATEDAPLKVLSPEQLQALDSIDPANPTASPHFGELYGGLKVLCERAANAAMPGRVLCLRPGLIVGSRDYTDRFGYWVQRVARGGEVLAPGEPARGLQLIDAVDLATWTVDLLERDAVGAFNAIGALNAVGSPGQLTMASLLNACQQVTGSDARLTWVTDAFLAQNDVAPWSELPLWIPASLTELAGFMQFDNSKALAAGLATRPVQRTIEDVKNWLGSSGSLGSAQVPATTTSLTAQRERALLAKWHALGH